MLGTRPDLYGLYFEETTYQFPYDAYLTSVDVDPLGYVFVTDSYNGVVYEFDQGPRDLIATYGSTGTADGQLYYPNRVKMKDGWHWAGNGWEPLVFGDAYVSESFGDQTGIRRFCLGYDILEHNLSYTPGPAAGYNDFVTCEWYQTGATRTSIRLYTNSLDFQEDIPSTVISPALLLPDTQLHRFFIDEPASETGTDLTYYFRVEGEGLYDPTRTFSFIDSIAFTRTFSSVVPDTPRIVVERICIEDPYTGVEQQSVHATPVTWYRLWLAPRDRLGGSQTMWKEWDGHQTVPAVFAENLGDPGVGLLNTIHDTVYAKFFTPEQYVDGDTLRVAHVRFYWKDSTGQERQYSPCVWDSSALADNATICWYSAHFDCPFVNCALPQQDCSCCRGIVGNVDGDPADIVDASDMSALIDFLFFGGTISDCLQENDIDGNGFVDIGDLEPLYNYLFYGAILADCPIGTLGRTQTGGRESDEEHMNSVAPRISEQGGSR